MPIRGAWPVVCLLVCALPAAPAAAQSDTLPSTVYATPAPADISAPPATGVDALPGNITLDNALTFDPSALTAAPAKQLRLPGYLDGNNLDVSSANKPDGSSSFTLKKPLPIDVDTKVGADLAPSAAPTFLPNSVGLGNLNGPDSGAAWASVGVPNLASLDARVDPNDDQGKIGTTLQHAMPVGSKLAVTLQDTFSMTDTLSARTGAVGSGGLPLMAALPATSPVPSQVWGNENKVKFDVLPTGTSLSAGVTTSNIDPVTHNTFSADQKLYGPLHVTTAISDIGGPTSSKSITAGVKLNW